MLNYNIKSDDLEADETSCPLGKKLDTKQKIGEGNSTCAPMGHKLE